MNDQRDLESLLASRFPLVAIETNEEVRARALLSRIARSKNWPLLSWSVSEGLQSTDHVRALTAQTSEPTAALRQIQRAGPPGLYVLLDFHPYLDQPVNARLLKEIALDYEKIARTLVLVGLEVPLPPDLDKLAVRFRLSLPGADELKTIIREEVKAWQQASRSGQQVKGERSAFDQLIRHLSGLTESDVRRLVRQALEDGLLDASDVERLIARKHEMLGRDSVLSFEIDTARFSEVAGLATLKHWLERRREAFLGDAAALGVDVPKGIMLLGVQGCGKSLAAKAVAGTWGTPLMRLDFGALYNKFLGETERNLRDALKVADAMAPSVLWMDEIEKGIATNDNDGGESRRILGTLLTWMAERKSKVFVVATSNDIEALPPELVRKGRLDEIFFVDLPSETARTEILKIHLGRRKQDPAGFDLPALVAACDGFSGAEIEQVVVGALYEARAASAPLATSHLLDEANRTKPLSVVMAEKIAWLRAWAQGRTVSAD
jgi:AAA+ superfamily predicted ATPase